MYFMAASFVHHLNDERGRPGWTGAGHTVGWIGTGYSRTSSIIGAVGRVVPPAGSAVRAR
jgi:hypothetical protein